MTQSNPVPARAPQGSAGEVFRVFFKLGLTSFGGPIAHLGYFRTEAVQRRSWLEDREYADLVALCQFLPGPASSQVGFAIGMHRAGALGALAAFLAFTLPSAVLMVAFAYGAALFTGPLGEGLLLGLKIVAVAIVAQAVLGMARNLAPDRPRASIAAVAAACALMLGGSVGQIVAIVLGGTAGALLCRNADAPRDGALHLPIRPRTGLAALGLFVLLLLGLPVVAAAAGSEELTLFDAFYRAGALVFGGGHVVLPLLQAGIVDPGWVSGHDFLAGYGAAQAVPGPLFTFAAFLGAASTTGTGGVLGAGIALAAVFLPGFLLLVGALPFWNALRARPWAQALMRGANAAVVGILAAALYMPVFTTAITSPEAFSLVLVCFVLLISWKVPPWVVVLVGGIGGVLLGVMG